MAPIIVGKRDLRNRNRTVVIDKKSKQVKSSAAKKLEALYEQDIGQEHTDQDDEDNIFEPKSVKLNLEYDIDETENQQHENLDLPDDFETEQIVQGINAEDPGNVANGHDQPMNKKEKKWSKRYDDLKKDFAEMSQKVELLEKEWKAIKRIVKRGDPQPDSNDELEDENYDELPNFPLKKVKHVVLMYESINNWSYKKQLIAKLRTIGGATIKKNVINIFKRLFSPKLKTRFCWKGSPKKIAFEKFDRIIDVIRQAVKSRHKTCKLEDIERECKLRFKQAEKDFEREQSKQSVDPNK